MWPKLSESAMMIVASLHSSAPDLKAVFREAADCNAVFRGRTFFVDLLVRGCFERFLLPVVPQGVALAAVGGYGRGELFPFSDVDLLLLTDKPLEADDRKAALSAFLSALWDSGLRLSQSVRSIAECCVYHPNNMELTVSLLDQRFLAGDEQLHSTLQEKLAAFYRGERNSVIRQLTEATRTRHGKYQNTIYHLEPHVKDGPGCIRDVQTIRWLARLRETELPDLSGAQLFLGNVRCELHFRSNRDNNQLTFAMQEELSPQPAAWMREFFRHARSIHRATLRSLEQSEDLLAGGLFHQFREWRSRISNAEFTVNRERVLFRSPQALPQDPLLLFRLFAFSGNHGLPLAADTEARVTAFLPRLAAWLGERPAIWPALGDIIHQNRAELALRQMYDTNTLQTIFPEMELMDCLVIRDFYHRYTVDEHTLVTIEKLLELRSTRDSTRGNFAEIFSETAGIERVVIALMFHDVGKGALTDDHAAESAKLARLAFERIGIPPDAAAEALFLIEQHLALSAAMNSRDLSDPATIEGVARKVGTVERLRSLTLMTYADISAVNPEAMTSWRLSQLWRLYLSVYGELTRELESERVTVGPSPSFQPFVEGFPKRYLLTHNEEELRAHAALEEKARYTGAAVSIRRIDSFYRAAVVTRDRARLLAALAGTLASFGLNIVKAEAFANRRGIVLDTFVFEDPLRNLDLNPPEVDRLRQLLIKAALGQEDVEKLLRSRKGRPRPGGASRIRPVVSLRSEHKAHTLVEIITEDRPGLLYHLASAISAEDCDIDTVLIHTEAHKAIDVLYVSHNGKALDENERGSLRARLLAACESATS